MSLPVELRRHGQAIWLDSISAKMIQSGELERLVRSGTVYGVTSNPTIFGQAIQKDDGDYSVRLNQLAEQGRDAFGIYDELTRADIAAGADLFLPVFEASPIDGWISLEVLPSLAHDTAGTVMEARRLAGLLGRPNVYIKVPATSAGCAAIRTLIGSGVSVNVTLMFNRKHYRDVADAYLVGLERLAASGGDLSKVHSVASFFVSRVDTAVDKKLDELAALASHARREDLSALKGKAGLANCKVVYQDFLAVFGDRFRPLAGKGARVQRPLWASTGTKNPAYSDLLYVENLIGPSTVNTIPEKTLAALLDHGRCPGDTLLEGVDEARRTLDELREEGIDVEAVGEKLQTDGVSAFAASYDQLLGTIERRRTAFLQEMTPTRKIPTQA